MPELPEVETTLRGIEPWLLGHRIRRIDVREPRLRWPVPGEIRRAEGQRVVQLRRRAKYLLVALEEGGLLLHLGMSGSIRVVREQAAPLRHDHVDIVLDDVVLRFNDPRRFGAMLWLEPPAERHPLLDHLGPEPLSPAFSGDHLWHRSRGRRVAVKNFVMDSRIVVGVGNIYASEALFMAGIHPARAAGRISLERYERLAAAVADVLGRAIRQGGTTLRDYVTSDGTPGYFAQDLLVYGREGGACFQCGTPVRRAVIGQRSSFYCPRCQR